MEGTIMKFAMPLWHGKAWWVAALCCASLVAAQAPCTQGAPITDLSSLKSVARECQTFNGDLIIQSITVPATSLSTSSPPSARTPVAPVASSSLSEPFPTAPAFNLHFLNTVTGSLEFSDLALEERQGFDIVAPSLTTLDGNLTFRNIHNLDILGFEQLGTIQALTLDRVTFSSGSPTASSFGKGQFNHTRELYNLNLTQTGVTEVDWWLAELDSCADPFSIYAHGNKQLRNITLSGLITGQCNTAVQMDVANNNHFMSVNLPDTNSLAPRISNVESFNADVLNTLEPASRILDPTYRMWFSNNYFTNLDLANVMEWSGTVYIDNNANLNDLNLQSLEEPDALVIKNNDKLTSISMPNLQSVQQYMKLTGPFKNISIAPPSSGHGVITVTGYESLNCKKLRTQIKKDLVCQNEQAPQNSSSAPSSHAPTSNGLSTGAKAGIGVGVGLGALAIIGALIFFLCVRRRKRSGSSSREVGADYSKARQAGEESNSTSPISYSKMPYQSMSGVELQEHEMQEQQSSRRPQSSLMGDEWTPPEQDVPSADGRVELEEQQGMRHEMDARSLPDMDLDDDDEEDTRSLNDIERIHAQR